MCEGGEGCSAGRPRDVWRSGQVGRTMRHAERCAYAAWRSALDAKGTRHKNRREARAERTGTHASHVWGMPRSLRPVATGMSARAHESESPWARAGWSRCVECVCRGESVFCAACSSLVSGPSVAPAVRCSSSAAAEPEAGGRRNLIPCLHRIDLMLHTPPPPLVRAGGSGVHTQGAVSHTTPK